MTDEFQKGLITGLAIQPLQVTTEHTTSGTSDIVQFGTHNLLVDAKFESSPLSVEKSGERVTINVPENLDVLWYDFTSEISFDTNRVYKISSSNFNGYGRIGITTIGNNMHGDAYKSATCINGFDNHLIEFGQHLTQFLIIPMVTYAKTQNAFFSFCSDSDTPYTEEKIAHSFDIALYAQILQTEKV